MDLLKKGNFEMKKLIFILLLCSMSSFASTDQSQLALKTIMKQNPMVEMDSPETGEKVRVRFSELLAQNMLSTFGANNEGALSVITNDCAMNKTTGNTSCNLNVTNSDRRIEENGSYAIPENGTDSMLSVKYILDQKTKRIKIPVTAEFAG